MKIGYLAKVTGCPPETIRFYEQKGLLQTPSRLGNNYRVYGTVHVERLHFIRRCRALDMSLDEVLALIAFQDRPDEPCDGVNELLDRHIAEIDRQVMEMQALQAQLKRLRSCCDAPHRTGECRILKGLAEVVDPR